jgi:hypothetical protein
MSGTACTVRTRKFMTNRLLQRKQFVRDSLPGCCCRAAAAAPRFTRSSRTLTPLLPSPGH